MELSHATLTTWIMFIHVIHNMYKTLTVYLWVHYDMLFCLSTHINLNYKYTLEICYTNTLSLEYMLYTKFIENRYIIKYQLYPVM